MASILEWLRKVPANSIVVKPSVVMSVACSAGSLGCFSRPQCSYPFFFFFFFCCYFFK
jgi:hypothetical protein